MADLSRITLISGYIDQLFISFNGPRELVGLSRFQDLFIAQKYTDIIHLIKLDMHLNMKLRIGYVSKGGIQNAPAWLGSDELSHIPPYGSEAFGRWTVTMYIRNSYLRKRPLPMIISTFAHEMAHIVLHAIRHPLRESEIATDLCAIVLGYSDIMIRGKYHRYRPKWTDRVVNTMSGAQIIYGAERGYLTQEEYAYVGDIIKRKLK